MRFSRMVLKGGIASAVAMVAVLAVGVSAASAVPAVWNSNGDARLTGTLSFNSGYVTCQVEGPYYRANGVAPAQAKFQGGTTNSGGGTVMLNCGAYRYLTLIFNGLGNKSGSAFSLTNNYTGYSPYSPLGYGGSYFDADYTGSAYTVPFVNGTASTSSTITYSNTLIGVTNIGTPLRATGTLAVTKADGSLLKLL